MEKINYNVLKKDVDIRNSNPFLDEKETVALQSVKTIFDYCLHSINCGEKCPLSKYIFCDGAKGFCANPRCWGYEKVDNTVENDGGLHRERGI